ncbi:MAG: hypothetical protein ACREHD_03285 [Pirellulales bacterium]
MNLPILLGDINATSVLTIIHWVGIGFIFLWFLGSCMKDGMWNNGLRCLNAYVAASCSVLITVVGFIAVIASGAAPMGPAPEDGYIRFAIFMSCWWVSFLVCLGILQTLTDKLSAVKLAFHPIVNGIGSFIFVCGITLVFLVYCTPIFGLVRSTQ